MSDVVIRHREKLVNYLSNPENEFVPRGKFPEILGFKHRRTLYRHFTAADLTDIEHEAFENRKKQMTRSRVRVYEAMEAAAVGYEHDAVHVSQHQGDVILTDVIKKYSPNPAAATVLLDRLEGKVPIKTQVTGKDGERLLPDFSVDFGRLSEDDLRVLKNLSDKVNGGSDSD